MDGGNCARTQAMLRRTSSWIRSHAARHEFCCAGTRDPQSPRREARNALQDQRELATWRMRASGGEVIARRAAARQSLACELFTPLS